MKCGFEKSSWRVSSVVIVVAAILGTIQEVIYRQAADGVFGSTKHSSTHQETKQVQLKGGGSCRYLTPLSTLQLLSVLLALAAKTC